MLSITSHGNHGHNSFADRPYLHNEHIAIYLLFTVCCLLLTIFLWVSVTNQVSICASLSFVLSAFFLLLCVTYTWHKGSTQRPTPRSRRIGIHWTNSDTGRQSAHLIDDNHHIDIEFIDIPPQYDDITPPPKYEDIHNCSPHEIIIK